MISSCSLLDANNIVVNNVVFEYPPPEIFDNYKVIQDVGIVGETYDFVTKSYINNVIELNFAEYQKNKIDELSTILVEHESNGVMYNNNRFATDKDSQIKYLGILLSSMLDPNYTVNFKTLDKTYVTLNAQQVNELCMSVQGHIQSCFNNDSFLTQQIMNSTVVADLDNINLNIGWP